MLVVTTDGARPTSPPSTFSRKRERAILCVSAARTCERLARDKYDLMIREEIDRGYGIAASRSAATGSAAPTSSDGRSLTSRRAKRERAVPWLDARRSLDHLIAVTRMSPDEFPDTRSDDSRMLLERAGLHTLASDVPA